MDSDILMQKASKDSVALFQHAISSYNTTPSRSLLTPAQLTELTKGRPRMQYLG